MLIELKNTFMGFSQNCKLNVENKMDGVHIEIIEAEYPNLINDNVIRYLVNRFKGTYDNGVHSLADCNFCAKRGFLAVEIDRLEKRLEEAKFIQKLAKRKNVMVFDRRNTQEGL